MVDAVSGLTPSDLEAAAILRRAKAPVIVAVNKADNEKRELEGAEFHSLGWEETYAISATHGRGTGDLLDSIVWALPPESERELARKTRDAEAEAWADEVAAGRLEPLVVGDTATDGLDGEDDPDIDLTAIDPEAARWDAAMAAEADEEPAAIAFVGRPNVGKSSLLNALLGEERAIVSDIPGTTRDAIDTRLAWGRSEIVLIDTAGIRRRGKVASGPNAEKYSTLRALHALSRADVAVLVIDARGGAHRTGRTRRGLRHRGGQGAGRRGQQVGPRRRQTDRTFDQYVEWIRNETPFLDFAPIVSISAKTGQRVGRVLEAAIDIWGERRKRVSTGELNRMLTTATDRTPPPPVRGRRPKIFYATQAAVAPPTFVSSPPMAPRSTSAIAATSRTGCARRSVSTARRSSSSSATGPRSSCPGASVRRHHPSRRGARARARPRRSR